MRVALTGTPGTGKTTVAEALAAKGVRVVHLGDLAREADLLRERDEERAGAFVVDVDELAARFDETHPPGEGLLVVEGHFAHELDVDQVVLLRVRPRVLEARLRARGWPETKVRENVEAEALDVIAGEVLDAGVPAVEVDATGLTVEEVADDVLRAARTNEGPAPGSVSWDLGELPWL